MTVIIFLIVLAILIFVHELGHFLLAKLFGVRVDAFALGFGPRIVSWRPKKNGVPGETEYAVNIVPFGGYVKIFGENPDEQSLDTKGNDASRSFALKSRWKQALVLFAGVLFNFIFAAALYSGAFMSGVATTADSFGQYAAYASDSRVMITDVTPGSPAEKAGLAIGDVIVDVGSSQARSRTITDIQNTISDSAGAPVIIQYTRGTSDADLTPSNVHSVQIIPQSGFVPGRYAIGIAMDNVVSLRLPFFPAVAQGVEYTGIMIGQTAVGLVSFVSTIFRGTADLSAVSGPVGIAGIVGDAAQLGLIYLVMVTALISVNLGVINLIPFPALDGGRILFVAIEGLIRRRIPVKFTNAVNTVGFILLMVLMVVVTYSDVVKLIK